MASGTCRLGITAGCGNPRLNREVLYRSLKGTRGTPQVFFQVLDGSSHNIKADLAISKRYLIRSGETLFCPIDEENRSRSLRFSASWQTILQDAFPEVANLLANEVTSQALARYLYCASNLREPDLRWQEASSVDEDSFIFKKNPVDPLIWTRKESRGDQFLQLAVKRLPELQSCLQADFSTIALSELENIGLAAKEHMKSACLCREHDPTPNPRALNTRHCLSLIAQTILVYLWILIASDIDDDIVPSNTGLNLLYDCQGEGFRKDASFLADPTLMLSGEQRGLALVYMVFAGIRFIDHRSSFGEPDEEDTRMALGGNGICVYRKILEDPTLPPSSIFTFRVVRGCITHGGSHFTSVTSLYQEHSWDPLAATRSSMYDAKIQPTATAVVEEALSADAIGMGYRVLLSMESNQGFNVWLTPSSLLHKIRTNSRGWICFGDCQPLNDLDKFPDAGYFWRNSSDPDSDWTITTDQDSIELVREMINQTPEPTEKWVSTRLIREPSSSLDHYPRRVLSGKTTSSCTIIVDEPFRLYCHLMRLCDEDIAMFPFIPCLTCLIEVGILAPHVISSLSVCYNPLVFNIDVATPVQKRSLFDMTLTKSVAAPEVRYPEGADGAAPSLKRGRRASTP